MKLSIRYLLLPILLCVLWPAHVLADTFFIKDIRVEGLQRVSSNTVFSALPIKANTQISTADIQNAVRAVFNTGFFADITIAREDDVLIVNVFERPVINEIDITGNKVIETENLFDALKRTGLSEGELFQQSVLDIIERSLTRQYSAVGRYAARIETKTIELPRNQVNVAIKVNEGKVASIKHINIVGNTKFKDDELQDLFEIKKTGFWSWIIGDDKYAQEKLSADLENLRAFYLNRGYLEFETISTQVSLSPDKKTVYITVNISEGEPYTINSIELAGEPTLPEEEINQLIFSKVGDVFSQEYVSATTAAIEHKLGDIGYSYANVQGTPILDKEQKTTALTFFIDPGTINYVRRIIFKGNSTTQDDVLRREMRQLEGAPFSRNKLERSKERLERLSLFKEVEMDVREVPGRPDQVDVIYTVEEQASGSLNASVGFSQGSGLSLGAGIQQANWLGTGNALGFQINKNDFEESYTFNYTNPYFTPDGISRGVSLFYQKRDLGELEIANFSTDRFGIDVSFGYPISERSRVSFGLGLENIEVTAGVLAAQEIISSPRLRSGVDNVFVSSSSFNAISTNLRDTNLNGFFDENDIINNGVSAGAAQGTVADSQLVVSPQGFLDVNGSKFDLLSVNLGYSKSTLNRGIFATKGSSHVVSLKLSAPLGDLEYYKFIYRGQLYAPLYGDFKLRFKSRIGYSDAYGSDDIFPFFENFFSGGDNSIRGFEKSTLGPKQTPSRAYLAVPYDNGFAYVDDGGTLQSHQNGNVRTIGGNILFESGVELIFPFPFVGGQKSFRTLLFVDAGNVFSDNCGAGQLNCSDFDLSKLSSSAGLAVQWLSPAGPLSISFSRPIKEQPFDQTENFQFSLGTSF